MNRPSFERFPSPSGQPWNDRSFPTLAPWTKSSNAHQHLPQRMTRITTTLSDLDNRNISNSALGMVDVDAYFMYGHVVRRYFDVDHAARFESIIADTVSSRK